MSNDGKVVFVKEDAYVIVVNRVTDKTTRVLNLIEFTHDRMVVHGEREAVMRLFFKLARNQDNHVKKIGIRKLAQLLEFFFDFRRFDNPQVSLGTQTIETELHKIKELLKEEEE